MCVRPKARQKVPPVSAADVLLDDVAMWLAPMQATDAVLTTYAPLVSAQPYAAEHCLIVACPRDGRARAARCTLYGFVRMPCRWSRELSRAELS